MLFPQQFLPQRETKGRRDGRKSDIRKNNGVENCEEFTT